MRTFTLSEIEDLTLFVNKTSDSDLELNKEEASAANIHLRKNIKFYMDSHLLLLTEKNPTSCFVNIRLKDENYLETLQNLLDNLQTPYRIYLDKFLTRKINSFQIF